MQCIIYLLKFVGQNLWYMSHTVIWCVLSNKVVQVWCRADCKKSLQNYICIGRHMMAMDGLLLAAKPYLKSKVQAKGWLTVHTKPGGIRLYCHFHHVCNSERLYENTIRVWTMWAISSKRVNELSPILITSTTAYPKYANYVKAVGFCPPPTPSNPSPFCTYPCPFDRALFVGWNVDQRWRWNRKYCACLYTN